MKITTESHKWIINKRYDPWCSTLLNEAAIYADFYHHILNYSCNNHFNKGWYPGWFQQGDRVEFQCRCSFLEIYNEQVFDLLDPALSGLHLREDMKRGVYVNGLSEHVATNPLEAYQVSVLTGNITPVSDGWLLTLHSIC